MRNPLLDSLLIALGAAGGANARYWLTTWFVERWGPAFPWGTLVINLSGSLLVGVILALILARGETDPTLRLLLVTGFLGAYTTFSTYTYDTVRLLETGRIGAALANALGSMGLGLAAAAGGLWLGSRLA
ncbi:MAG: fluoride efflux transporter CrcB [Chloroflexota bacterium]|nr:fluoride efflux transporter CrcB [Chloroflexota bacterium]